MFILDSSRYSRDPSGVSGQIPGILTRHGGEVLASRLWDERRLAYSIDGHRKGTYWLTYFRIDSKQLAQIRRDCEINENILRSLILKIDPRIAETLVTHALSAPAPAPRVDSRPGRSHPATVRPEEEKSEPVGA
jgi:small subunit ribosomal protein S6